MTMAVEAIFENGVLKPVNPLELAEHQVVHLIIQTSDRPETSPRPEWHWKQAQTIDDGFTGTVADEVTRQRRES